MTRPFLPPTPELMLQAYATGVFPMAESRHDPALHWIDPLRRGIMPLDGFRVSRSLRRRILRAEFDIAYDSDFAGVVRGCAERPETWINDTIFDLTCALHRMGRAHSVEVRAEGSLAGGIYGVELGGAFFAESMFSRRTDASKVALAYLVHRLRGCGFVLMDTQFLTPHLQSLGGREISREAYRARLARALRLPVRFDAATAPPPPQELVQRSTQIS